MVAPVQEIPPILGPRIPTAPDGRGFFEKPAPFVGETANFETIRTEETHTCFRAILGLTAKRRPRSRSSSEKQTVQRTRLRITQRPRRKRFIVNKQTFFYGFRPLTNYTRIQYYLWYENHHSPKSSTVLLKSLKNSNEIIEKILTQSENQIHFVHKLKICNGTYFKQRVALSTFHGHFIIIYNFQSLVVNDKRKSNRIFVFENRPQKVIRLAERIGEMQFFVFPCKLCN